MQDSGRTWDGEYRIRKEGHEGKSCCGARKNVHKETSVFFSLEMNSKKGTSL